MRQSPVPGVELPRWENDRLCRIEAAFRWRGLLLARDDNESARREFAWPEFDEFNWALDWFDVIAAEHRTGPRCRSSPTTGTR